MIRLRGRPMTLRRPLTTTTTATVTLTGFFRAYRPEQITGSIEQGDAQVSILADEILAANWPGPPRRNDTILIENATWALQGSTPVFNGAELLGFELWVRGGK